MKYILIIALYMVSIGLKGQQLKVIAYNVEFGRNTTPEAISSLLRNENPDIICFNEVPAQGWTIKVGQLLGMLFSYEGKIASANHNESYKDRTGKYYGKYKSILSKFPLDNTHEVLLEGIGWSPASAVIATIRVNKKHVIQVFSLHIPTGAKEPDYSKAHHLAQIIRKDYSGVDRMILAGDFNDLYESQPLYILYNENFRNSWKTLQMDLSGSTTLSKSDANGSVIDHILYKGLKLKNAGIIEEKMQSDHKAVWSLFKL